MSAMIARLGWFFFLLGLTPANASPQDTSHGVPPTCVLSGENLRFIQTALDGWERASREFLRLEPLPLPWMVLFDRTCVWHLAAEAALLPAAEPVDLPLVFAGEEVSVRAQAHEGTVRLPDGMHVPVRAIALTALYQNDQAAYLVLALLDVWRLDPNFAEDPHFEANILGVMSHEITHTRHLVPAARRIRRLGSRYALPGAIHDDIIEERFQDDPDYVAAYQLEMALFYRAVAAADAEQRRSLVAEALALASARRNRYFLGAKAVYRELEDIFLNLEGVAVWSAYKLAQTHGMTEREAMPRSFGWSRSTWSHDQGLALFLLLEQLVPDWQVRVLGPELAAPFTLLRGAITNHAK